MSNITSNNHSAIEGYKKVPKPKVEIAYNEIRVTSKGEIKKYLGYAL